MELLIGYALLRIALGLNIFMHGIVRICSGRKLFTAAVEKEFEQTVLPGIMVKIFAGLLPFVEALTGLLLCAGLFTKFSLLAGSFVMLLLLLGKSLKADWQVVSLQMIYIACYVSLIMLLKSNHLSLDQILFG